MIKLEDISGTTLKVVQVTNGWSHELRIRVRGEAVAPPGQRYYRRGQVSGSIPFKAPDERDDWCDQVEGFLDDPGKTSISISTGRYGRNGGHLQRDPDGTYLLMIKSPRYSSRYDFRITDADLFRELIGVLRSVD